MSINLLFDLKGPSYFDYDINNYTLMIDEKFQITNVDLYSLFFRIILWSGTNSHGKPNSSFN